MPALEGWMRHVMFVVLVLLIAACAAPSSPGTQSSSGQPAEPPAQRAPKKITSAILANPFTLSALINTAGGNTAPGIPEVEVLVHAGLATATDAGLKPQIAESVPSVENGAWRVNPDGS